MTDAAMPTCERHDQEDSRPLGAEAKPFLKWAGGKRRLVPNLQELAPKSFGTYYEPFLGGGAAFFGLRPERAVLSDSNQRLVRTYSAVRDSVERVIDMLRRSPHTPEFFEQVRRFRVDQADDISTAAWFIYLNKTAFNGLYRVNAQGKFNVPFGKYSNPTICDEPALRAASTALQSATVHAGDFADVCAEAQSGDFIYFDPPYAPKSSTSNFTGYTPGGFTLRDHRRLRDLALTLKRRGVHVLLSNSAVPAVLELYEREFELTHVAAARAIAANGSSRGTISELLIR